MATHEYRCPNCGHFDVRMGADEWAEHYAHWCKWPSGHEGLNLADYVIRMPAIEPLENCGSVMYHPETGEHLSQGFHNFLVDGPRGDGTFQDRAEYKAWQRKEGLEETGGTGNLQALKDLVTRK